MQQCEINYFMEKKANILENSDELREPQKQAYYKIYKHFVIDGKTSDAIIVLPTGVGKTGVMGLCPFQICQGRVLIITPQLTVKDTVIDSLNTEDHNNFWYKRKILNDMRDMPVVVEYEKNIKQDILGCANIVILNIHKLQERLESSLLKKVEPDFFDMIIVDEAHHSTANTWVAALNYFSKAKVVKLTATPFRSDGEELAGELVYEYKLSQAMAREYIKSLVDIKFIPEKVEFIRNDDNGKKYSEEEILELEDEDWISKSVVLSEKCSRDVVKESIALLNEKRENSSIPHKIIAVACNIEHAEKIKLLYEVENVKVAIVHSKLDIEKIKFNKNAIENNSVDVVINVGMLGEGYDHKYLSIAAIFRPFRSELPYRQFIGRILRYIPEATSSLDNIAQIVSHKLLYLDSLWVKYKKEIEASEIIKKLCDENFLKEYDDVFFEDRISLEKNVGKIHSQGGKLETDVFLETEVLRKHRQGSEETNRKIEELVKTLKISKERARSIVESVNSSDDNKYARPDLVYKRERKDIDVRIREEIVPELYISCIKPNEAKEKDLKNCEIFKTGKYSWILNKVRTDEGRLAAYFNTYLKNKIMKQRNDWEIEEYRTANELLDKQTEYIFGILKDFYNN